MPPWNAVKGFGEFRNDHGLTQEEISLIAEWVEGGAPEGDPQFLPPKPTVAAPKAPVARELAFSGSTVLKQRVEALGIRVEGVPASADLQVVAVRPDGSAEPLVWVRAINSADEGVYWYRSPVRLPVGTKIQLTPDRGAGALLIR
jgi:hypothetical protein